MHEIKRVAVFMQPVRPYCRRVLMGVAAVSAQARWECILIPADAPPPVNEFKGFVHGLIGHFVETPLAETLDKSGLPAVDISPSVKALPLPRVTTDDVAVGRLAAAHLLSLGLPHFAFFGTRTHYYSLLREKGFKESVGAAGLSCHVFLDKANGAAAAAAERDPAVLNGQLDTWLRDLPKPIGILAGTDSRALHLLAVCRKLDIDVPGSVAVLGVDNDEVYCDFAVPTLSSIALATHRIGYEAARMLDRLMSGGGGGNGDHKGAGAQLLVPPAGVVPRRSTDVPAIMDADVAAAVRFISLHVADHLHVADVLREIPMSRRSMEQRFRKALGRTPAGEIRRAQIEVAKQILAETDEPMARVALAAGFSNAKQLGASFFQQARVTPTVYRRQSRKAREHPAADMA
jgi:LacI family transcriptional regulator